MQRADDGTSRVPALRAGSQIPADVPRPGMIGPIGAIAAFLLANLLGTASGVAQSSYLQHIIVAGGDAGSGAVVRFQLSAPADGFGVDHLSDRELVVSLRQTEAGVVKLHGLANQQFLESVSAGEASDTSQAVRLVASEGASWDYWLSDGDVLVAACPRNRASERCGDAEAPQRRAEPEVMESSSDARIPARVEDASAAGASPRDRPEASRERSPEDTPARAATSESPTRRSVSIGDRARLRRDTNLRSRPSGTANAVGLLESGRYVTVLEVRERWLRVADGSEATSDAWIEADVVDLVPGSASAELRGPQTPPDRRTTTRVSLRSEPSVVSRRLAVVSKDRKVEVLGEAGLWLRVRVGDQEGWMYSEYVTPP